MARKKSKSSKTTSLCFELPLDLLSQILGRLPVKTLLKFRCVSKEWQCLIDSSDFASLHFSLYNSNRQNAPLFLIEGDWRGFWKQRCSTRRVDNFRKTCQFDLTKDFGNLKPVSYANGFVLCRKSYYNNKGRIQSFVICNPSTRKWTEIIYPSCSKHNFQVVLVCVGGSNDDYRLVVIPYDHPSWMRRGSHLEQKTSETVVIEVYSFCNRSWRSCRIDMKCIIDIYNIFPAKVRAIVPLNGAVHWLGRNPENEPCIVAVDVQNEAVQYFALPAVQGIEDAKLSVLHESLVLVKGEDEGFHIWVMERYDVDGSWANRFQIDTGREKLFLYLRRNGELFFSPGVGVNVCDIESGRIKNLAKSYGDRIFFMDTFVETLASLPRGRKEPKKTMQTNYNEHVEEQRSKVPAEGQPPPHIMPEGDIRQDKSLTSQGKVQGMGDGGDVMKKKIPQIATTRQQCHGCDVPYDVRVLVTELNREQSQHADEPTRESRQLKEDIRQQFEQLEEQFQQQQQRMEQKLEAQYEQMQQRLEQKLKARFEQMQQQMEQKLQAVYEQTQQQIQQEVQQQFQAQYEQIQQQLQAQWVQPFMASSSSGGNIGDGALAHRPGGFGGGSFAQTAFGVAPTHLHGPLGGFQQQIASFCLRSHHHTPQPTFVPQQTAPPYEEDAFVGYPGELFRRTNTSSQVNEEQADEDGGEKDDNDKSYVQVDEDKDGEEDDMEP